MSHSRDTNVYKILKALANGVPLSIRPLYKKCGIPSEIDSFRSTIATQVKEFERIKSIRNNICDECGSHIVKYQITPKGRDFIEWIERKP